MDFDEWWNEGEKDVSRLQQDCERLLNSSNYDSEYISEKEKELWYYSEEQLLQMKYNLLDNQTDRIEAGHNYTQTDIKRKLR